MRINTPALREKLSRWLQANVQRPLWEATLQPGRSLYGQIAPADAQTPQAAILSVTDLDSLPAADEPDGLLRQLNWQQAAYSKLKHPLLLWAPEYLCCG